jgi:energy-coupling factor transporter transmembrane protein EcfT
MKVENRKIKNKLILFVPIFIVVFLISSTNTLEVIFGLVVYIITLLLIYFISLYTDKKFESKFNKICLSILIVSFVGIICGILTFSIQEKINSNKAENFVAAIEKFKRINKRLPKDETEIVLPKSRNGLYEENFEYCISEVGKSEYIIKYFNGFWDTKVYVSSSKKWYVDD